MAGVVAMASVIEDFDSQPCKKSRKDGGIPVVKTITNYFTPLSKSTEKPFSPPRSNNIMDYFIRKAPCSKEKASSPEQLKENCQTSQQDEKHPSPGAVVKQTSQKRSRKTSKAARKLVEAETIVLTDEESCLIVEEPCDNRNVRVEPDVDCSVFCSDTTALLFQLSPEACVTAGKLARNFAKTVSEKDDHHLVGSKCGTNVKLKPELNCIELSPIVASKDKTKQVKTVVQNSLKKQQQKAKPSDTEEKDDVISLCDDGMEASVDEAFLLNRSMVTISFEEFVRSQSQDRAEENIDYESKLESEREEIDTYHLRSSKAEENVGSMEPPLRVSPRTVTIQADVHSHVALPKLETKAKVASIFSRRKAKTSPAEVELFPHMEARQQLTSTSSSIKRKSNVILDEEDLELAVIESESTPKSSEAERKQFMAAFKQVSLHGSKAKTAKNQGNQKQPGEVFDDMDKVPEEDDIIPASIEQVPSATQDNKMPKSKHTKKGEKKVQEIKEVAPTPPAAAPEEEAVTMTVEDDDDEREKNPITSLSSVPILRRSSRGASVRQPPETTPADPTRKTMRGSESKDAAVTLPKDSPAGMSTQKTRKSKHGVFVAEMVGPPDTKQSPIRIKFTRVHKNVPMRKAENGLKTSLANKTINESKNRRQAKKLVEKAKMIQQSKKAAAEEKGALRRSVRAEANVKKSYCEDENSVICLEEDETITLHTASEKSKTQKSLRNLNDVLGKATPSGKETKPVLGSKVALLGQEKSARKVSEVISIFDESSREGSENSQDDEQFRARREFLKSGLPECFRKQIAKTAATKEAYSLSCSSFQPVIHVKQPAKDCPLWSLLWPESLLLSHLKELWCQTSNPPLSVSGSFSVKTEPARRTFYEMVSGWRPEISERVRQILAEEVGTSDPQFPVQMFVNHFVKRCTDHQLQSSATEPATVARVTSTSVRGKRKRIYDEREMTVKVAKKHRASSSEENISSSEPAKRGGRMTRSQSSMPDEEHSVKAAPIQTENDSEVVLLGEDTAKKDFVKEDVLWTDKYQPQNSSHIIGNTASVKRLHSWLKEWKLRADREERKKQKDKTQEEESHDSEWDCGEEDSQDGEDILCNTMLITGPTGVGKTAAVYACAQELGFKVFEVNASSQRSGRLILSQLKEATQSHQVDSQGVNAHKPTYFNSYGTSSSAGTLRPGSSPRKVNSPRRVVSSPRKHPQSPRGTKRGGLAPTSLANFFKMGRPTNKETSSCEKKEQTADSKNVTKASECAGKQKVLAVKAPTATTPKEKNYEEHSKKTATSLILFEEVDIIFDDDSGFLAAIKTFMTTTKRPVILTTSDPAFSTMFDGNFEEINFKAPSVSDASSFLRLLCLAEDIKTDQRDISSLLRFNGCDMRRSLLQLQFWARSGGSRYTVKPMQHMGKKETDEAYNMLLCDASVPMALPPAETRCTESMLGLLNIEPERDIWELLKSHSLTEERLCRELLTNSRQLGMDLLYSNLETLLPLPLSQLTASTNKPEQCVSISQDQLSVNSVELPFTCSQLDKLPSQDGLNTHMVLSEDCLDDGSPVKISSRMRRTKKRHRLPDQDGLHSGSDSEDSFLSLSKQQGAGQKKEDVKESVLSQTVKRKPPSPEEQLKSLPVSQCLQSIAEFLDNMSYMDSSFPAHPEGGDGRSGKLSLVKDGMNDDMRVEIDGRKWARGEHTLEIQAAVEATSFYKCRALVAEAWDKTQQLEGELRKEAVAEVTLPVAAHCDGYSLNQDGPIQPQLVERRREVMESLMFRGVCGTLGNRSAAALDYLPALRTICRSEQLKEQGKVKRRFLHYLDSIHLALDKSTLQHLAEDFP